ncbi:hypothetical protein [Amycolatopsis samaneae]|uniref:Uncharacterized protein n=1 Tax=Amycolatopsis samaneae TaxID=664691 RepID=A0ABW5GX95_9PSEU
MGGKHRKKDSGASRGGCAVIMLIAVPALVLLTTVAGKVCSDLFG